MIVLAVAANAGLIGASRLSFNMGEYYQLPKIFYRLHAKFRTPYVSLAFFSLFAALVILASRGRLQFLADLYNFGAQIAFFSAHISLIVLRIKRPHLKRPFMIPCNIPWGGSSIPVTAVLGAVASVGIWGLVIFTKPEGRYLGFAWMFFGIGMYLLYRYKQKIQPMSQVLIKEVEIPGYRPLDVKKILVPVRGEQTETVQMACELARVHKASVTAIEVLEIAATLPLDSGISHRVAAAEVSLKRVEAIARDCDVDIELKIIRSRSLVETILEVAKKGKYDLIVLGALKTPREPRGKGISLATEEILRKAPCRVWICAAEAHAKGTFPRR